MSYKPKPCYCWQSCRYCEFGDTSASAIAIHNLRTTCHGERPYPGDPDRGRAGWSSKLSISRSLLSPSLEVR